MGVAPQQGSWPISSLGRLNELIDPLYPLDHDRPPADPVSSPPDSLSYAVDAAVMPDHTPAKSLGLGDCDCDPWTGYSQEVLTDRHQLDSSPGSRSIRHMGGGLPLVPFVMAGGFLQGRSTTVFPRKTHRLPPRTYWTRASSAGYRIPSLSYR